MATKEYESYFFEKAPPPKVRNFRAPGVPRLVSQTKWGSYDGIEDLSSLRRPPVAPIAKAQAKDTQIEPEVQDEGILLRFVLASLVEPPAAETE